MKTAKGVMGRLRGLLGRSCIGEDEALYIEPCSSIHTFFMKFPIDAVFVDGKMRVAAVYKALRPWRLSMIHPSAAGVVELAAGRAAASGTEKGDQLAFVN